MSAVSDHMPFDISVLPKPIRRWSHLHELLVNCVLKTESQIFICEIIGENVTEHVVHISSNCGACGRLSPDSRQQSYGRSSGLHRGTSPLSRALALSLCSFRHCTPGPHHYAALRIRTDDLLRDEDTKAIKRGRLGPSCHAPRSPPATGIDTEELRQEHEGRTHQATFHSRHRQPYSVAPLVSAGQPMRDGGNGHACRSTKYSASERSAGERAFQSESTCRLSHGKGRSNFAEDSA